MSNKFVNLGKSVDSFYEKEIGIISKDASRKNLFSFSGVISEEMVYDIGVEIENYLKENGAKKGTIRRIFFMFTESMQNIRKHGMKNLDGSVNGAYIVETLRSGYLLSFYSSIKKIHTRSFLNTIDQINSLSKDNLKVHYREVLDDGEMSDKGGAGLGLISLALKCTGPLLYDSMDFGDMVSVVKISFDLSEA